MHPLTLDTLRQPLESGYVEVHRSAAVAKFPARFMLVLAANPCPSHLLVRERDAVLVTNVADIIEAISPLGTHTTPYPQAPKNPIDHLDHDLRRTLDAVPLVQAVPAARIATTAGLDLETTQECLETLAELSLVQYNDSGWRLTPTTTAATDPAAT